MELATKVMYSQKETTATLVEALIPYFAPKLPPNMPATRQAITPDECTRSAMRNEPKAAMVLRVISIR